MKVGKLGLAVVIATMVGCVKTHRGSSKLETFDPTTIVKGQTTEGQLVDQLGAPQNTAAQMDGTKLDEWTLAEGKAVVAPFYHTNHVAVKHLKVTFKDGVAVNYATSDDESF